MQGVGSTRQGDGSVGRRSRRRLLKLGHGEGHIHDSIRNRFAGHIHAVRRQGIVGLAERALQPRVHTRLLDSVRPGQHVIHLRGNATIHQVPQRTTATIEPGKDLACIRHDNVLRRIPQERVVLTRRTRRVRIRRNPHLNVANLTTAETRKSRRHRRTRRLGAERDGDLLLREVHRVGQGVGRHIHTTGKSIALIFQENLLDRKLTRLQGRQGTRTRRTNLRVDRRDRRHKFDRHLDLLRQQVRRDGRELTIGRRDAVGQGQPHIGRRRTRQQLGVGEGITAECEEVITGKSVRRLTQCLLQDLLT